MHLLFSGFPERDISPSSSQPLTPTNSALTTIEHLLFATHHANSCRYAEIQFARSLERTENKVLPPYAGSTGVPERQFSSKSEENLQGKLHRAWAADLTGPSFLYRSE